MGGMGHDLHNMVEEMECYAAKLHQVYKRVEVRNMFFLWEHKLFTLTQLKFCKRNLYSYSYAAKSLSLLEKDFILAFRSIRSLGFHIFQVWKCNFNASYYAANIFLSA